MQEEINIEKLRKDLIDYFGPAIFTSSPLAIIDISKLERASEEEIIKIAQDNNFDLTKYIYNSRSRY